MLPTPTTLSVASTPLIPSLPLPSFLVSFCGNPVVASRRGGGACRRLFACCLCLTGTARQYISSCRAVPVRQSRLGTRGSYAADSVLELASCVVRRTWHPYWGASAGLGQLVITDTSMRHRTCGGGWPHHHSQAHEREESWWRRVRLHSLSAPATCTCDSVYGPIGGQILPPLTCAKQCSRCTFMAMGGEGQWRGARRAMFGDLTRCASAASAVNATSAWECVLATAQLRAKPRG